MPTVIDFPMKRFTPRTGRERARFNTLAATAAAKGHFLDMPAYIQGVRFDACVHSTHARYKHLDDFEAVLRRGGKTYLMERQD